MQLLATHAVVQDQGRRVADGTLADLVGYDCYQFEVDDPARAVTILRSHEDVASVTAIEKHPYRQRTEQ